MIDVKVTVPFMPELSKNKRYAFYKSKMLNPKHKQAKDLITYEFKKVLPERHLITQSKFYVKIVSFRPNRRSDASNFINPAVDAIKVLLPMDDNYCAGSWDFEEDKLNPRIEIQLIIP